MRLSYILSVGLPTTFPICLPLSSHSPFYHDLAAALIGYGDIVAANRKTKVMRRMYGRGFQILCAIQYSIDKAPIASDHLNYVRYNTFNKLQRLLDTYVPYARREFDSFIQFVTISVKHPDNNLTCYRNAVQPPNPPRQRPQWY